MNRLARNGKNWKKDLIINTTNIIQKSKEINMTTDVFLESQKLRILLEWQIAGLTKNSTCGLLFLLQLDRLM